MLQWKSQSMYLAILWHVLLVADLGKTSRLYRRRVDHQIKEQACSSKARSQEVAVSSICYLASTVSNSLRKKKFRTRDLDNYPPSPWLLVRESYFSATRRRVIANFDAAGIPLDSRPQIPVSETQDSYVRTTEQRV